ncbi:MAG: ABC transporter ATP-binding protein, partial [Gluconacetobacter diazotrophicus]|nr:ABC transporter ATP-binding protein [Gluconacetobacter diazotrophicus]
MTSLRLENLSFAFSPGRPVVDGVSLALAAGEFFCLLGPSGSGKSTFLRLVGGYLEPQAGRVWLRDREVTRLPPERREMGMVFQNYALFPHLDALGNVAFGLRVRGMRRAAREEKAREILTWVGLKPEEFGRLPAALSGGQQQRVALARALVFGPGLLMLDEPFANLDRSLRERLRDELRDVQRRLGTTTILITHDREEALALGDRLGIMHAGRLLQTDTPERLYRQPRDAAVARLLGHPNVLDVAAARGCGLDGDALLWPERLRLDPAGAWPGEVRRVAFAGSHRVVTLRLDAGPELQVHAPADDPRRAGDRAALDIPPDA